MYGNVNRKKYKDSEEIRSEYYYYQCKHRRCSPGVERCNYNHQWKQDLLNAAVESVVYKLVRDGKLIDMIKGKIGTKIDTSEIDEEIENNAKQLKKAGHNQERYMDMQNALDLDDRHYDRKMQDYERQTDKLYDEIEQLELQIERLEVRKEGIQKRALTVENIYKYLIHFDLVYAKFNDDQKKEVLESFIEAVHIFPEQQPNGQVLKCIDFRFPISYHNGEEINSIGWDKDGHVECVCLMTRKEK